MIPKPNNYICSMILVADSGSTKCDWLICNNNQELLPFYTMGFNPMFHDSVFIESEILKNSDLIQFSEEVSKVFFYGASVSSDDRKKTVSDALSRVFKNAQIEVDHDLMGAARATCGSNSGIACILGTGSNSCYFDGKTLYEKVPALGYILGDEGSGAWFGKELLKNYLYHNLSAEINSALENSGVEKENIFKQVYQQPGANVYLASFMKFIHAHKSDPTIQKILISGFTQFIEPHICKFENYTNVPVHFVGSVAVNFKDELQLACDSFGIKTGIFTNQPIQGLMQYHLHHAQL